MAITMIAGNTRVFSGDSVVDVLNELQEWQLDINTDKRQHFTYVLTWLAMIRVDRSPANNDYSDWYIARATFEQIPKQEKGD